MTFSRLTLGEPRLKSKLRGGEVSNEPPCEEPLTTGANILPYSDFEDVLSQQGGGPNGNEILYRSGRDLHWPSEYDPSGPTHGPVVDTTPGGSTDPYHLLMNSPPFDSFWVISTANPDTGTYHARLNLVSSGSNSLVLCRISPCEGFAPVQNFRGLGGLVATIDFRAAGTGNGTPQGGVGFSFYDQSNGFITSTGTLWHNLSSSYGSFQTSWTLPANTWFWTVTYFSGVDAGGATPSGTLDVDNITVALE